MPGQVLHLFLFLLVRGIIGPPWWKAARHREAVLEAAPHSFVLGVAEDGLVLKAAQAWPVVAVNVIVVLVGLFVLVVLLLSPVAVVVVTT